MPMKMAYRAKQLILSVGDLLSFFLAFWFSLTIRWQHTPTLLEIDKHITLFSIIFFFWIVINYINGLYDLERNTNDRKFYRRFTEAGIFSLVFSIAFFYLTPDQIIAPKTILFLNIIIGYTLSGLTRVVIHRILGSHALLTNIVFVGFSKEAEQIINILNKKPEKGYKAVAIIDPTGEAKNAKFEKLDIYSGLQAIRATITTHHAHMVVIAPHLQKDPQALRELYELLFWPVQITDLTSFYENITGRIPPSTFSESWFLENLRKTELPVYDHLRTLIDFVFGIVLGVFLLLVSPFIILAIKLTSPGPALIKQTRIGKFGEHFLLYKFRSMYALSPDGSAEIGTYQFATKDDKRITAVGKFLRKTRLDELPQIINLLKRDVTLIGPRPERPEIVKDLQVEMPYYPLRHLVRPGLTGWALIHQNYTDTIETSLKKLQYDLYYIKNRSALLDIIILLRTVNVLVRLMGQ